MNDKHIVWADDEIGLLRPHLIFMEEKGYRMTPVNSGEDAIRVCSQEQVDLLLIDEPVAGMTEIETKKTSDLLLNIAKDRTIIVVEHDMNFIESLNVEIIVLHEGSVLTRGNMNSIKRNKQVIDVYLGR